VPRAVPSEDANGRPDLNLRYFLLVRVSRVPPGCHWFSPVLRGRCKYVLMKNHSGTFILTREGRVGGQLTHPPPPKTHPPNPTRHKPTTPPPPPPKTPNPPTPTTPPPPPPHCTPPPHSHPGMDAPLGNLRILPGNTVSKLPSVRPRLLFF